MRQYRPTLIPFGIGLALAIAWQSGLVANAVAYLRADLGTLFLLTGLVVSALWAGWIASRAALARRYQSQLGQLREEQTASHNRFIRRLDHELKNPLTAIRAGLANIDQNDGAALKSVRTQVDRLARLSADLRKLAEIEKQPVEQEPVDLASLLTELIEIAKERPEAERCQVRLTLPNAPWPLAQVAGDRDLLFLALHNLLDNAYKFSRQGDLIEVRAFEVGAWVVVEVADTGPGVYENELEHLGEELFRGSAAMSVEGSGLGLALVQAIVARHKGTMSIRSRVGQGTVVSLRLSAAR